MRTHRIRWMAWTVVLVAGGFLAWSMSAAEETGSGSSSTTPGAGAQSEKPTSAATANPKWKKTVDTFMRQLGNMKPTVGVKKDVTDCYLVATAELTPATGHADVRFELKQSQQSAAEYLADFVLGTPDTVVRKYQVISRLKDSQQGDTALAEVRTKYDQMVAYQAELKKAFAASSVRRT